MADKQDSRDMPYEEERSTEPSGETGNINSRNNNVDVSTPGGAEQTVEGASNAGIGDATQNGQKLTSHTSNHSADA